MAECEVDSCCCWFLEIGISNRIECYKYVLTASVPNRFIKPYSKWGYTECFAIGDESLRCFPVAFIYSTIGSRKKVRAWEEKNNLFLKKGIFILEEVKIVQKSRPEWREKLPSRSVFCCI